MIESSCHCGALKLEIDAEMPAAVTNCNCSVCFRYGALTGYFPPQKVKVVAKPGAVAEYSWGDKGLAFVRCATCGCYSHWRSLTDPNIDRMGINMRLVKGFDPAKVRLRNFDGANTWKYLE